MELILLVPIVILSALLWWAVKRIDASQERFDAAYEQWAEERKGLLQRIQAPERAVIEDFQPSEEKQWISLDDDDAFQAYREELSG